MPPLLHLQKLPGKGDGGWKRGVFASILKCDHRKTFHIIRRDCIRPLSPPSPGFYVHAISLKGWEIGNVSGKEARGGFCGSMSSVSAAAIVSSMAILFLFSCGRFRTPNHFHAQRVGGVATENALKEGEKGHVQIKVVFSSRFMFCIF